MHTAIKQRGMLLLILPVFVLLKLPHLGYAYYWDECFPYAAAIRGMYDHGVSLLPGAIDTELSKGHPMLFHAMAAVWMRIFGISHVALHSFALAISLLLLVMVYEAGLRLFNQRVGILATLLVATQVVFFVQASFVLPEVVIALLAFCAVYCYINNRLAATAALLAALFCCKETGLVVGLVLGVDAFVQLFNRHAPLRLRLARCGALLLSIVPLAVFLVLQQRQTGWYLYPEHVGYVRWGWDHFWYTFRMSCLTSLIMGDNRYWYYAVLLPVAIAAAVKNKSLKYLAVFFLAVICYYFVDDMRAGRPMPSALFFTLFLLSVCWMLYILVKLRITVNARQTRFMVLMISVVVAFSCFSAFNFFTVRYMIIAIVPFVFFTAVLLDGYMSRVKPVLFYIITPLIVAIGMYSLATDHNEGDTGMNAFAAMKVQQAAIDYLVKQNAYNEPIGCDNFLEYIHLVDPATGFLPGQQAFTDVKIEIAANTHYVVFDNIGPDQHEFVVLRDTTFHLAFRYQADNLWCKVYARRAAVTPAGGK